MKKQIHKNHYRLSKSTNKEIILICTVGAVLWNHGQWDHLVNGISYGQAQSDPIKRRPLYQIKIFP